MVGLILAASGVVLLVLLCCTNMFDPDDEDDDLKVRCSTIFSTKNQTKFDDEYYLILNNASMKGIKNERFLAFVHDHLMKLNYKEPQYSIGKNKNSLHIWNIDIDPIFCNPIF